jgi:hypothetical protein
MRVGDYAFIVPDWEKITFNEQGCSLNVILIFGGSGWIRTIEVVDNRFTVCPLWPLGNTPTILSLALLDSDKTLELVDGLEPPTC